MRTIPLRSLRAGGACGSSRPRSLTIALATVLVAACTDPVVDMQLVLPRNADTFNTSCVTAVEVHVNGATYPQDPNDFKKSCVEISGAADFATVRSAIHGKFTLPMPDTGLSGIELYGWSGPSACAPPPDPFYTNDLMFFASAPYIGQDSVELPIVPSLNCVAAPIKVRPVDLFTLISGATPTSANCTLAAMADGTSSDGTGVLIPKLFSKGTKFFGGLVGGEVRAGVAQFNGPTQVGPKSCLALSGGSTTAGSTTCVIDGPGVCAGAGEIEHAFVNGDIGSQTISQFDAVLTAKYHGIVYGSVWSNGATKHPLAGATVDVDPADGAVVYVDPPDPGSNALKRRDGSTGPTGLFLLYTSTLASVTVHAGGASRTVTLASPDEADGAALIVMP
jgi:hypothetical protein